jgi:hypothetical protein
VYFGGALALQTFFLLASGVVPSRAALNNNRYIKVTQGLSDAQAAAELA